MCHAVEGRHPENINWITPAFAGLRAGVKSRVCGTGMTKCCHSRAGGNPENELKIDKIYKKINHTVTKIKKLSHI